MSKVKVKICGITNWTDARSAVEAGVQFLGFNFYRPSPRYIRPALARQIIRRLPERSGPRKDRSAHVRRASFEEWNSLVLGLRSFHRPHQRDDSRRIFSSRTRFDATAHVDRVRMRNADRFANVLRGQSARKKGAPGTV